MSRIWGLLLFIIGCLICFALRYGESWSVGELDKRLRAAVRAAQVAEVQLSQDVEVQSWVVGGAPDVLPSVSLADPSAILKSTDDGEDAEQRVEFVEPGGEGEGEKRNGPPVAKTSQQGDAPPKPVPLNRFRANTYPPTSGAGSDWKFRVPRQLVLTAKQASLSEIPPKVRSNVDSTLALNPGIKVLWLGDRACSKYIRDNHHKELAEAFENELRGSYRGDICRAAVLAREGGFYVDLDVELRVPFHELIDASTTFMSAYTEDGAILNAILAAPPNSTVMTEALEQIRALYSGRAPSIDSGQWMGPTTLLRALNSVVGKACKGDNLNLHQGELQWTCGVEGLRLYHERRLQCGGGKSTECPASRAKSGFLGVQFGLFTPGEDRNLIGWPRFAGCSEWGCKAGGWDVAR